MQESNKQKKNQAKANVFCQKDRRSCFRSRNK